MIFSRCFGFLMTLLVFCDTAAGQVLKVIEGSDKAPLHNVEIKSSGGIIFGFSNNEGEISLDTIPQMDRYIFEYPGYERKVLSENQLRRMSYVVVLNTLSIPLKEIIISSTKWRTDKRSVPNTVEQISTPQIELHQPQTAADLLSLNGSIFIQKSQQGGGSPMVRGFSANRVLLTIDGIRMNNAIFRSGNLHNVISIDPSMVDKTELIFGPGSLIYGSDAIGGVMNFFSKEPSLSEKPSWHGGASVRYASANRENHASTQVTYRSNKVAVLSSFSYNRFGDLRMGSRNGPEEYLRPEYVRTFDGKDSVVANPNPLIQILSGYRQYNTLHKIQYQPDPYWNLQYAFHFTTTGDIPRYDRLIEYNDNDRLSDAEWYYGPQSWSMHHLRISHYEENVWYSGLKINLARQQFGESRHNRNFGALKRNNRFEEVPAWSLNVDAEKKMSPNLRLYYGLEGIYNQVRSSAFAEDISTNERSGISTRYPDGSYWYSAATYLNALWQVSNRWRLQGGVRYNAVGAYSKFEDPFFVVPFEEIRLDNHAFIGSIGAVYQISTPWQFNISLGNGFRAPNIDDISKVFDSEPGNVTVPNPMLRPETAYNMEASLDYNNGGKWAFRTGVFYTYLSDAMVRRPFLLDGQDSILYDGVPSAVIAIVNVSAAYVYGIEMLAKYRPRPGLTAEVRYNIQHGEETLDDGSRGPLRHAAPGFGRLSLQYKKSRWIGDLFAIYQHTFAADRLAPSEVAKPHLYAQDALGRPFAPSWWTLNISLSYMINPFFKLNVGLDNMLDRRYRPYSSGITAPGINLRVGMKGMF